MLDVLEDVIKEEKNKFNKKLNNIQPKVPQPDKPPAIQPHPDVSFIDFLKILLHHNDVINRKN